VAEALPVALDDAQAASDDVIGICATGFAANCVITVLFAVSPWFFYPRGKDFDPRTAMFDVGVFLVALGVSTSFFAYSAYRDYLRLVGGRGPGSSRRRSSGESGG